MEHLLSAGHLIDLGSTIMKENKITLFDLQLGNSNASGYLPIVLPNSKQFRPFPYLMQEFQYFIILPSCTLF